jgi:hypothetical protein
VEEVRAHVLRPCRLAHVSAPVKMAVWEAWSRDHPSSLFVLLSPRHARAESDNILSVCPWLRQTAGRHGARATLHVHIQNSARNVSLVLLSAQY